MEAHGHVAQIHQSDIGSIGRWCDWSKFRSELRIKMRPVRYCVLDTPAQIDEAVNQFTSMLQQIVTDQVPLKRVCSASRDWWSPKIKELRIQMWRAF